LLIKLNVLKVIQTHLILAHIRSKWFVWLFSVGG